MDSLISRQAAIDAHYEYCNKHPDAGFPVWSLKILEDLPSAQPEIVRCKDCKHFELDHFEKVEEFPVPIIVAHEICMKWSDGCRTSKDGWCFMGERRTDE